MALGPRKYLFFGAPRRNLRHPWDLHVGLRKPIGGLLDKTTWLAKNMFVNSYASSLKLIYSLFMILMHEA